MSTSHSNPKLKNGFRSVRIPPKGILSPINKKKPGKVMFMFPSQVSNVKNISRDLDEMVKTLSVLGGRTMSLPKKRLIDPPISLVGYKSSTHFRNRTLLTLKNASLISLPRLKRPSD